MYSAPYSCTLTLWSAQKSVSGVPGGYEGRAPRVHHQQWAASPSDAGTLLLPSCDEGLFDLEILVLSVKWSQSYASFHVRGAKADLGLMFTQELWIETLLISSQTTEKSCFWSLPWIFHKCHFHLLCFQHFSWITLRIVRRT